MSRTDSATPASPPAPGRGRRLAFRLVGVALPLILLAAVEVGLRVRGHWRPTSFWVDGETPGELIPNTQFASRFVGSTLARMPRSARIQEKAPANTLRVVVFGESAAMGDPEPAFGMPRFLEALLEARYPGRRIEVINTAVTALNSHAIRAAARDSVRLKADVWVVYAGNNEIIGPFGPAAVPAGNPPSLGLVSLGLKVREFALGQWLSERRETASDGLSMTQRWVGLEQFLDRQVAADDPRVPVARGVFSENLKDIVSYGLDSGAQVILSTMAVNLVDSAPFASRGAPKTNEAAYAAWSATLAAARDADDRAAVQEAVEAWNKAVAQHPGHAETLYRLGLAKLNAGDFAGARSVLEHARDEDTLRFRADSGMNEAIRQVAEGMKSERLQLLDADRELRGIEPEKPPGADLFLEHVHLRPEGNYRLARLVAERVTGSLAAAGAATNWLSYEDCQERLGLTPHAEARLWTQTRALCQRPPFSEQSNAELRSHFLDDRIADANAAARKRGLGTSIDRLQAVVKQHPDDWNLGEQLIRLQVNDRRLTNAASEWTRVLELAPKHVVGWQQLGETLAQLGNRPDALRAYERALEIRPDFVEASLGMGLILGEMGRLPEALQHIDTALKYSPKHLQGRVNRGVILAGMSRHEEAAAEWRRAAADNPKSIVPLVRLAEAALARKDSAAAAQAYYEATQREPGNAVLQHRLAIEYSHVGRTNEAEAAFRKAVQLQPKFATAHLDLGVVLAQRSRFAEAIVEFEETLRLDPNNAPARKYLEMAREQLSGKGGP